MQAKLLAATGANGVELRVTMHIEFCLDEIACEIDALDAVSLSDAERTALEEHVSCMRLLLAARAARTAALALTMPPTSLVVTATSAAETATGRATAEMAPVAIDVLPPPVAPVPAPIRIVNVAKPAAVVTAVDAAPTLRPASNVVALPVAKPRRSDVALMRIAASLLIAIGLGTGAGMHQLQAQDPLMIAVQSTLAQSLADGQAKLLDAIEAGRKLMSQIPDLGGQKS